MSLPTRETYPFMPPGTAELMYLVVTVNLLIFLIGARSKLRFYGIGPSQAASIMWGAVKTGWRSILRDHVAQKRVAERKYPGVMHIAIYVGTIILFIGTTLVFLDYDILRFFGLQILRGGFYLGYETVLDFFGIIFLLGLALAISRRLIMRPKTLRVKWDDVFILFGLFFMGLSGFILEGMRLVMKPVEWKSSSFIGASVAPFFTATSQPLLLGTYQTLWWIHALVAFGMLSTIPYTKLGHIVASWANSLLRDPRPMGRLSTPFDLKEVMEKGSFDVKIGLTTTADLDWRRRLNVDTCLDSGRCEEVCPANAAGRDLSPRLVVQDIARKLHEDFSKGQASNLLEGTIRESEAWSCTTCNACVQVCPVAVNQLDLIIDARRALVAENKIDERKRAFLAGIDSGFNPFGLPISERAGWLEEEGVPTISQKPDAEYLYWIGCQSSYDARCKGIVRSMVKIMGKAGVSFAVLGREEKCSGEPVRRLGEEGRFQQLAMENIETFKRYGVKKIVTHCAHCFNTFKNEYPEFGGECEVTHHSEFLFKLIAEGRIRLKEGDGKKVVFHDPCNLGRINKIYDPPREVLRAMNRKGLVEMEQRRENAFCCGAGGANPWYTVPEKVKISEIRAGHAEATGAEVLAVACPFCLSMFEDAFKGKGSEETKVRDIAEMVADCLND